MTATQHLGPMRDGGSGAQLYKVAECEDEFVVKLKGTKQGIRVLYNEYVAGRIGELIGVPFGEHVLVQVSDALHPPPGGNVPKLISGTQFGTTHYQHAQRDATQLKSAKNFNDFPAVLVFDTFIARCDSRQFIVYPSSGEENGPRDMGAIFDQGYAFTGSPNWTAEKLNADNACVPNNGLKLKERFPDFRLYEPYIERVEALKLDHFMALANEPPLGEWEVPPEHTKALARWLDKRKMLVREAVENYLR